MYQTPVITTPRLHMSVASSEDVEAMRAFHARNDAHLRPWAARRPEDFGTLEYWMGRLALQHRDARHGRSLCLALRRQPQGPIVGEVNFRNFIRGSFQACHLGYHLGEAHIGQGLMHEALRYALAHVFDVEGLHRVQANYIPHNTRSANVLARLGFVVEGYARDYLKINDRWEDHVLTALCSENFARPEIQDVEVVALTTSHRAWLRGRLQARSGSTIVRTLGRERDAGELLGLLAQQRSDATPIGALVLEERAEVVEIVALLVASGARAIREILLGAACASGGRGMLATASNDDLELQAALVRHGFRLRAVHHDALPTTPGIQGVLCRDVLEFERRPL